jgi:integrase
MAVRSLQHRDFHADALEPHHTVHPTALNRALTQHLESELNEERRRGREVVDHDAHVLQALNRHALDGSNMARSNPRGRRGRLRFHDLRHSAATLALAAGANTRELLERMGHTSPAVALRYQHVMAGRDQAIAATLDELVQAAASLPPERPTERLVAR